MRAKKKNAKSASAILTNVLAGLENKDKLTAAEIKLLRDEREAERAREEAAAPEPELDPEEYAQTLVALAALLAITTETLRLYRATGRSPKKTPKGWPVGAWREWLAAERGKPDDADAPVVIKADPAAYGMKPGAAHALADIEKAEMQARANYFKAREGNDAGKMHHCYTAWEQLLEVQMKFVKLVPASARTGGKYYTEEEFGEFMKQLGTILLRLARPTVKKFSTHASAEKNARKIAAAFEPILLNVILSALDNAWKHNGFDRTAADALKEGLGL